jgi:hypothetical protein
MVLTDTRAPDTVMKSEDRSIQALGWCLQREKDSAQLEPKAHGLRNLLGL